MFKVLGKDAFDKLRVKINSITELSCFKEDEFTIHMELEKYIYQAYRIWYETR